MVVTGASDAVTLCQVPDSWVVNAKCSGNDPCTPPSLEHANGLISMKSRQSWHRGHCDFGFHYSGLLSGLSVYSGGVVKLIFKFHSFAVVSHYCQNTHFCGSAKSMNQNHTRQHFSFTQRSIFWWQWSSYIFRKWIYRVVCFFFPWVYFMETQSRMHWCIFIRLGLAKTVSHPFACTLALLQTNADWNHHLQLD